MSSEPPASDRDDAAKTRAARHTGLRGDCGAHDGSAARSGSLAGPRRRFLRSQAGQPPSLRVNFSWTLLGNVVYAACQALVLVVLARLGTPDTVGQYSLGLAVCSPVMMLANLQLRELQATEAKEERAFGDYIALRLVTTASAFLVIMCIALLTGYRREVQHIIIAIGLQKGIDSLSDLYYGFLQQGERLDRIAQSLMLKGPVSLLALGLVFYLTRSASVATLSAAGVQAIVWLLFDRRCAQSIARGQTLRPRWRRPQMRALAWTALPLGLTAMIQSLGANVPRYFVEGRFGEADLGLFTAAQSVLMPGSLIVLAIDQSISPRLAKSYSDGDAQGFRRLLGKTVLFSFGVGAAGITVCWAFGSRLLSWVYGSEYGLAAPVITVLAVSAALDYVSGSLGVAMLVWRRRFAMLFGRIGLIVLLSATLSLFQREAGLMVVAYAMVAGSAFHLVYRVVALGLARRRVRVTL